jgi:hypothetical protein
MAELTDERIAEIEALVKAATPGPLDIGIVDPILNLGKWFEDNLSHGEGNTWLVWAPNDPQGIGGYPRPEFAITLAITGNGPKSEANAEFIIATYNAMPELIDEIRRLRAQHNADQQRIADLVSGCDGCNLPLAGTSSATLTVLAEVAHERQRQNELWGVQNHSPAEWVTILTEENGEMSRGAYEMWHDDAFGANYREEAIHVAAVAVAAAEAYDRAVEDEGDEDNGQGMASRLP